MYINAKEHAEVWGGYKDKRHLPFKKLPLHCCALSLQPLANPVCLADGSIYDAENLVPYVKKFKVNPVTGAACSIAEIVPVHLHKNRSGRYHDPVTEREFSEHMRIVVNRASGHIYAYETVEELNKKTKNFSDLVSGKKFKWSDIVTIQDPTKVGLRQIDAFHYMRAGQQEMVQEGVRGTTETKDDGKIRQTEALERFREEKQKVREERVARGEDADIKILPKSVRDRQAALAAEDAALPPVKKLKHTTQTTGAAAVSFTSTKLPAVVENEFRDLTEEEVRARVYERVRKKKLKGYVRIVTDRYGMLNFELHCDMAPITCDNFMRHCESGYYNNTIFHRCIRNFIIQGGDPEGTGKGGRSCWRGGKPFRDEFDSRLTYHEGGMLAMANSGKNTNKSQFFITFKMAEHLLNKHTLFGRLVGGMANLEAMNNMETGDKDRPLKDVRITSTTVFQNPFTDVEKMLEEEEDEERQKALQKEKEKDQATEWLSKNRDVMQDHAKRNSDEVGKYMEEKKKPQDMATIISGMSAEEKLYAKIAEKPKGQRSSFEFSGW